MTAFVTSRPAPRKRATTSTTRKPPFPRFRLRARRPFGPSSGNQTAYRSPLSFACSFDDRFPAISGHPPERSSNHRPPTYILFRLYLLL